MSVQKDEKEEKADQLAKDIIWAFKKETIMIIGGTGSLGQHITRVLVERMNGCAHFRIIIVSRDENKQWILKQMYGKHSCVEFILGDMRDKARMSALLRQYCPGTVILASALKHIDICEHNVAECIKTNVQGVQNVVEACVEHTMYTQHVLRRVLFISTDKACSPVNVYGMCKALGERIVTRVHEDHRRQHMPKFLCVRYGNVLNSRGSIIPKFAEMAKDANTLSFPITDPTMTRFFMTLDQSVNLIFHALLYGESGETWIPRIPAISIYDLAQFFAKRYKKEVEIIGKRPGEKEHECLINECELERTVLKTVGKQEFYSILSPGCHLKKTELVLRKEYKSSETVDFQHLLPLIEPLLETTK